MNAELIERMGQVLGSAYPRWEANEGTWLVFGQVVGDIDPDAVLAACWAWVREQKYPPSPAEIRAGALRWWQYLYEVPAYKRCRIRIGSYDAALGPEKVREIVEAAQEESDTYHKEALDEIQRQTGKSAHEHLEEWRKQAEEHMAERKRVVAQAAQGRMEDPVLPDRLLLPSATAHLTEDS